MMSANNHCYKDVIVTELHVQTNQHTYQDRQTEGPKANPFHEIVYNTCIQLKSK